jgi:hypothetical protein
MSSSTGIVDSHVHLAYYPVADQLAAHGVTAVVDLAAPESALARRYPLRIVQSGPMLTSAGGYPLDSWGVNGYGIPCDHPAAVNEAVRRLADEGAGVIKIAADDGGLSPDMLPVAVAAAHARGLRIAVHALTNSGAKRAAAAGADILAHTPVELLDDSTIAAWKGRAVITTLAAFGGSDAARLNLKLLHDAGVTVLYGTDLGNLRVDGPSADEQALMKQSGLTDAEITAAMTTVPWHYWGFDAP